MATVLATAALAGLAQLLGTVAQERRLARQQTVALREATNLMEDLASRGWDEIRPQGLASLGLSEECRRVLPDGKLQVEVTPEDQDAKRIRVQIDWRTPAGNRVEPVRLVAWKYRNEEPRP
jgi:hypothetical protein